MMSKSVQRRRQRIKKRLEEIEDHFKNRIKELKTK
jgi:hypothetical protein